MTAPIWQQEEGGTRFKLSPVSPGSRAHLIMTTHDIGGLGPFALLDPIQAAALRDALTAWLDEGATVWLDTYADDDRTLSLSTAELVERDGPELLAHNLKAEIRRRRAATARYWNDLVRFERANAGGLAVWRACEDSRRQGLETLRVADLLALIDETPTRKEDA